MGLTIARWLHVMVVVAGFIGSGLATADEVRIADVQPTSASREAAKLEISILGSGFAGDASVRFLVSGTNDFGGITVNRVVSTSSRLIVVIVEVDPSVPPGQYDIEVSNANGGKARTTSGFQIEHSSSAARFGCTGAETWRRRIPCKRGTTF